MREQLNAVDITHKFELDLTQVSLPTKPCQYDLLFSSKPITIRRQLSKPTTHKVGCANTKIPPYLIRQFSLVSFTGCDYSLSFRLRSKLSSSVQRKSLSSQGSRGLGSGSSRGVAAGRIGALGTGATGPKSAAGTDSTCLF